MTTPGAIVKKLLWFLVVGSIAVFAIRGIPEDSSSWLPWLQQKEQSVKENMTDIGESVTENVKKAEAKVKADRKKSSKND